MLGFKLNGARGYVKEGLDLTPMGSFDVSKGGINSGPGSYRIPEGVCIDGPGFSLCAAPLESSSPGFQDGRVEGCTSGGLGYTGPEMEERITARGGLKADGINGMQ